MSAPVVDDVDSPGTDVDVDVVIITRNRSRAAVASASRALDLPGSRAVIVVDNASDDGTPEALGRMEPPPVVVRSPANLAAAGRNLGAEVSGARYVAFADDDTWWESGALARAADVLDAHPGLGGVAARLVVEPGGRTDPTCEAMAHSPLPAVDALPGTPVLGFLACASVLRRSAFLAAGGFDRHLGVGGEEHELVLDLWARGEGIVYLPDIVAHHDPHPSRDADRRAVVQARNDLWTIWLRYRTRALLGATFRHLAGVGVDRPAPAAWREALAGASWVVRERRAMPRWLQGWEDLCRRDRRRSASPPRARPATGAARRRDR